MVKKQLIVVAYDISSNKRRKNVSDLLEQYGARVNYSVFECLMAAGPLKKLKAGIEGLINNKQDTILYYQLCASCIEKIERQGNLSGLFNQIHIV